jgi:hypothetical protein
MDISLNGNDTISINGILQTDLADGDVGSLTFPNEFVTMKPGKNNNTIIAFNAMGQLAELTIRLIRGSVNDQQVNSEYRSFVFNPAGYNLMEASIVKLIGDGNGNITTDSYILQGGVPMAVPEVKSNVEGDTDQGVTIWKIRFAMGTRQIQS